MRLSDLQNKEIVSTISGKNIGSIIDIEIDPSNGKILTLLIEPRRGFKLLSKNSGYDSKIEWTSISKIGEDVILVNK